MATSPPRTPPPKRARTTDYMPPKLEQPSPKEGSLRWLARLNALIEAAYAHARLYEAYQQALTYSDSDEDSEETLIMGSGSSDVRGSRRN